jgi:hypothetical protein
VRRCAPLTVRCAICWATLQDSSRAFVAATRWPLISISSAMSSAHGSSRRYSSGSASGGVAGAVRNGSSAAIGTTHGEIDVANDLPRNGPSGVDSHACTSRALQSLSSTTPNTCSSARPTGTGSPMRLGAPTTKPSSSSTSSFALGPNRGAASRAGRLCPCGRRTGVPPTTTVAERPW